MPHLFNPLYDAVSWVLLRFHDFWSIFFSPDSGAAWGLSATARAHAAFDRAGP